MPVNTTSKTPTIAAVILMATMVLPISACSSPQPTSTNASTSSSTAANANNANANNSNANDTLSREEKIRKATSNMSLSSPSAYSYTLGDMRILVDEGGKDPVVKDFSVTGFVMAGDQHGEKDDLCAAGYKMDGQQKIFFLGEEMSFYLDDATVNALGENTCIVALPHRDVAAYQHRTFDEVKEMAEITGGFVLDFDKDKIVNENGLNLVGKGRIDVEEGFEGLYDILICTDGLVGQYVVVELVPAQ